MVDGILVNGETKTGEKFEILLENLTIEHVEKITNFISQDFNVETYYTMDEETRERLINKLTLITCFKFSPRKNWNVSREDLSFVIRVIANNTLKRWIEAR